MSAGEDKYNKQIRMDNLYYMKGAILARYACDLLSIAVPVVIAWLIGDMADYLLALEWERIFAILPYFLLAMILNSLGTPLANMFQYQRMIKQSFAYDEYMMCRFIHKPLRDIQRQSIGEILERLGGDLGDFCWNTVILVSTPAVIVSFGVVIVVVLLQGGVAWPFLLLLILLPGISVLKAQLTAGKRAVYQRELAEYNEKRRELEAETLSAAEFLRNYRLETFTQRRLRKRFEEYMENSGCKKRRFESACTAADIWIQYGVALSVLAAGALMTTFGVITPGMVLTGYLVLSSVQKCYTYGVSLTEQKRAAKEYMERIRVFYGYIEEDPTQDTGENVAEKITRLQAKHLSFSYDLSRAPVFSDASISLQQESRMEIHGENGSGKSTLFYLLGGLYAPEKGVLEDQNGRELSGMELRQAVAFQEQNGYIFSGTVWENLFSPEDRREEAEHLLAAFGFEKTLEYETQEGGKNLSPGEKKKLLLVRALLRPSQFCLLDEPLNHLDERGKKTLEDMLLADQRGIAVITHHSFLPDAIKVELKSTQ